MYCPSCGKPNQDGARFCTHCGAQVMAPTAAQQPQLQPQYQPQPQPGGKGKLVAVIVAVAVVAAIVIAGVATGGFGMMGKSGGSGLADPAGSLSSSPSGSSESGNAADPATPSEPSGEASSEGEDDMVQGHPRPKDYRDYEARAKEIAMATFTNAESGSNGMKWVGSDASSFVSPKCIGIDEDHLQRLDSKGYLVIAKSYRLLENDGEAHKYRVQVVYEESLNADGTNVQANIAEVGIRLDNDGLATTLTVTH